VRYPAAVAILMGAALMVKRLDGGRRSAPAAPPTASKPKMNPPTWAKNATPRCLILNSPELRHDELGQEPHLQYTQAGTLIRKMDTNMTTQELGSRTCQSTR